MNKVPKYKRLKAQRMKPNRPNPVPTIPNIYSFTDSLKNQARSPPTSLANTSHSHERFTYVSIRVLFLLATLILPMLNR